MSSVKDLEIQLIHVGWLALGQEDTGKPLYYRVNCCARADRSSAPTNSSGIKLAGGALPDRRKLQEAEPGPRLGHGTAHLRCSSDAYSRGHGHVVGERCMHDRARACRSSIVQTRRPATGHGICRSGLQQPPCVCLAWRGVAWRGAAQCSAKPGRLSS